MTEFEIWVGDITNLDVDAIVNAANNSLLGGGGVDGAIHRAAGPLLLAKCKTLGGCETGAAKITPGYALKARYIIHTVGPIWGANTAHDSDFLLGSCYVACLKLAAAHHLSSIAFPAISTGAYGFPPERAADIALKTVKHFCTNVPKLERVIFCCFNDQSADFYRAVC